MFSMALWMTLIVAPHPRQMVGDMHGLNTLKHQPAKIAAIEGTGKTGEPTPLLLFGWPDMELSAPVLAEIPRSWQPLS